MLISICIPAYKQEYYLKRLLDSIISQTYKEIEVVITDDSNDDSVKSLVNFYSSIVNINYKKNNKPLGSPENWNEAIRLAKGEWIKIMHDDDWFYDEHSLAKFAAATFVNENIGFIFSGYTEVNLVSGLQKNISINRANEILLKKTPLVLFKENLIGHPSTTLIKKNTKYLYDKDFKWVVDIEFYIRYLTSEKKFLAVKEPLIKIGINEHQITKQAFRNPVIEIPEVIGLLNKLPTKSLRNIFMYDYYWRFIRNLSIRKVADIEKYAPKSKLSKVIEDMILQQSKWPLALLRMGVISKSLMFISYLRHRL